MPALTATQRDDRAIVPVSPLSSGTIAGRAPAGAVGISSSAERGSAPTAAAPCGTREPADGIPVQMCATRPDCLLHGAAATGGGRQPHQETGNEREVCRGDGSLAASGVDRIGAD